MTIPFLINYEPYTFPQGTVILSNINDMVSIDTNLPETIEYGIGAVENFNYTITITNLTKNATLEVTVEFNKSVLMVGTQETVTPIIFTIAPTNQQQLQVYLNKETLDTNTSYIPMQGNISFVVKNLANGTVVFKNV